MRFGMAQAAEDVLDNLEPSALVEIKASGKQGGTLEDSELFKRVHSQVAKVGEMGLGNMMGNVFGGNGGPDVTFDLDTCFNAWHTMVR